MFIVIAIVVTSVITGIVFVESSSLLCRRRRGYRYGRLQRRRHSHRRRDHDRAHFGDRDVAVIVTFRRRGRRRHRDAIVIVVAIVSTMLNAFFHDDRDCNLDRGGG